MIELPPETSVQAITVTELNRRVKGLLEGSFSPLRVEGELSNFAAPPSGHWYFTLKDAKAQVRCAMFQSSNQQCRFLPENGMQVMVYGQVTLYGGRGDYQIIVKQIEPLGSGALQLAFEQLKRRLAAEGLFDSQHKKLLPTLPRCVGMITSPSGAVIHDMLHRLAERFPLIKVIIYPASVQGEGAADAMVQAISMANARNECDLLVLARGGGSLEDLWPFNEERLARAIFASQLPIVSAVGHEVDVTIADFVADCRAATPTAAAEIISPDGGELAQALDVTLRRLQQQVQRQHQQQARLLSVWADRLQQQHPKKQLMQQQQQLLQWQQRLILSSRHHLTYYQNRLQTLMRALHAVSPLATLARGYAVVKKVFSNEKIATVIYRCDQIELEDILQIQLHQGEIVCRVVKK